MYRVQYIHTYPKLICKNTSYVPSSRILYVQLSHIHLETGSPRSWRLKEVPNLQSTEIPKTFPREYVKEIPSGKKATENRIKPL